VAPAQVLETEMSAIPVHRKTNGDAARVPLALVRAEESEESRPSFLMFFSADFQFLYINLKVGHKVLGGCLC